MLKNKNIKIFLNYWLGPVLFVWLSWSIYRQVKHQPDLQASWNNIREIAFTTEVWKLALAGVLVFVNWGLEAKKWMVLVSTLTRIGFLRSLKAILAGLAFAVNTPNRIGEYGGRVLYLPEGTRMPAVSLTLIGSYSQLLVTLLMGTTGLWLLYLGIPGISAQADFVVSSIWIRLLCVLLSTITCLLLFMYLRISWLVRWIEKIPGIEKWSRPLQVIDHLPVRILLRVFGWSVLRYVIFVIQYILLLQIFRVTPDIWSAWWLVSILFLVLAIIPTIAMAEIGIRGKLALELFGWVSTNQLGIISAAISIWLINLIIPAIIGSLLIIRIKIFSTRLPKEN